MDRRSRDDGGKAGSAGDPRLRSVVTVTPSPYIAAITSNHTLRRRFIDWSEPALPAVARALATEHAGGSELDLDRLLMVFPGGRSARRMTELLEVC